MSDISTEATLAREEEERTRAGALSIAAGVTTLLSGVLVILINSSGPSGDDKTLDLLPALERSLRGEANPQGLLAQQAIWLGEHWLVWALSGILLGAAALLALFPLRYLFRAAQARNPQMGRGGIIAVVSGCIMLAVGSIVGSIALALDFRSFADAEVQTSGAVRDILGSQIYVVTRQLFEYLGGLALAFGLVIVALNAMRVGLLTRFFGILGILAGVLMLPILRIDAPGIVRSFFFISLGLMILGRWMGGRPPAWATGKAEPWPSQQEQRERRAALARGEDPDAPREVDPDVPGDDDDPDRIPAADPSDPRGEGPARHPGSRKRRKRR
jgi:hypothetical protein